MTSGSAGFGNGGSTAVGQAGVAAPRPGTGGPMGCASAVVNTSTTTPDILFVIDGSGSMCESFGNTSRWQALRTALLDPMNGLVYRLQASAVFGMVLYDGTIDLVLALSGLGGGTPPSECAAMYTEMKMTGECPQLIQTTFASTAPAATAAPSARA